MGLWVAVVWQQAGQAPRSSRAGHPFPGSSELGRVVGASWVVLGAGLLDRSRVSTVEEN